jgi:hypothetical protein
LGFQTPYADDFFEQWRILQVNLSWFWRGWFQYNWRFDQGINAIKYVKNDQSKGLITVEISKKIPIILDIKAKKWKSRKSKIAS